MAASSPSVASSTTPGSSAAVVFFGFGVLRLAGAFFAAGFFAPDDFFAAGFLAVAARFAAGLRAAGLRGFGASGSGSQALAGLGLVAHPGIRLQRLELRLRRARAAAGDRALDQLERQADQLQRGDRERFRQVLQAHSRSSFVD